TGRLIALCLCGEGDARHPPRVALAGIGYLRPQHPRALGAGRRGPGEQGLRRDHGSPPQSRHLWPSSDAHFDLRGSRVSGRQTNVMDARSPDAKNISIAAPLCSTLVPLLLWALNLCAEFSATVSNAWLHSSKVSTPPVGAQLSTPWLGNIWCVQAIHASTRA